MDAVEIEIDVAEEEEEEAVLQQENVRRGVRDASSQHFEADSSAFLTQEESVQRTDMVLLQEEQNGQDCRGATVTVMNADADMREELNTLSATEPNMDMNKQRNSFSSTVPSTQSSGERFEPSEWVTPVSLACYYGMNANGECTEYSLAKVKIEPGVETDTQTAGDVNVWQESLSNGTQNADNFSENVNPSGPIPTSTNPYSLIAPSTQLSGQWYETNIVDSAAFGYNSGTNFLLTTLGSVQMSESECMSVLHVGNSGTTVDAVSGCSVLPVSVSSSGDTNKSFPETSVLTNSDPLENTGGDRFNGQTDYCCASESSHTEAETLVRGTAFNTSSSEDVFACEHPGCGASFTMKKSLKLHVMFGHKPQTTEKVPVIEKPPVVFKCMHPDCSAVFHLASHLNEHRATHTEGRPHKCSRCHIAFSKELQLKGHKCVPRKLFRCDRCNATVFSEDSLEEHKREVHMKKCIECKKSFEDDSALKYHFSFAHTGTHVLPSGRFQCPACGDAFSSVKRLKQHSVVHTEAKTLKCSHCSATFRKKRELKSHIHTHKTVYKCEDCGLSFSKAKTLSKHNCDHKKLVQCTECDARFVQEKALNSHMVQKHGQSVSLTVVPEMPPEPGSIMRPEPRMKLDHAPVPIACYYNLGASQAQVKIEPGIELQSEQAQAVALCQIQLSDMQADPQSDKSFMSAISSSNSIIQTVSSGTSNSLVSTASSKTFSLSSSILPCTRFTGEQYGARGVYSASSSVTSESLLSSVSSDVSNDVDDYNDLSISSFETVVAFKTSAQANLDREAFGKRGRSKSGHETNCSSSKAKPELVFRCVQSDCSAVFHSVADLDKHRALHRKKSFRCKRCNTLFVKQRELQKHLCERVVTDPPFRCKKCGARFVHKVTLAKHIEAAHETKGFTCAQCQRKYFSAQELQAHVERKHPMPKKEKTAKSDRKLFQCGDCDAVFSHAAYLASHRIVHTGDKPFKCPQCPLYFRKKSEYKTHQSLGHRRVSYKCEECGASFCKASTLAKHKTKHQKPFKCSLCPVSYLTAASLESHMFFSHPKELKSSDSKVISQKKYKEVRSVMKGFHNEPVIPLKRMSVVMHAYDPTHSVWHAKPDSEQSGHKVELSSSPQLNAQTRGGHSEANLINAAGSVSLVNPGSPIAPFTRLSKGHGGAEWVKIEKSAVALQKEKTKPGQSDALCPPGSADDSGILEDKKQSSASNPSNPRAPSTRLSSRRLRTKKVNCGEADCNAASHKKSAAKEHDTVKAKPFKCSNCHTAFRIKAEFDRHRKMVRCPECGIVYNNLKLLRKHMPVHHLKPYKCAQCGNMYAFQTGLKKHVSEQHLCPDQPALKLFQCADCDAVFSNLGGVESHRQVHDKDRLSKCTQCCAIFRSNRKLKEHIRSHWTVYSCEKCNARFFKEKTLKGHMNRHRERPFTCSRCEATFITDSALRLHMNKFHLSQTEDKVLFPSATKLALENCVTPEMPPVPGSMEPLLEPLLKPESAAPVPIACYFNLGSSAEEGDLPVSSLGNTGESGVFPVRLERVGPAIPEDEPQIEFSQNTADTQIEEMDVS